jgi:GntR family transcriptional regulator
MAIRVETTSTVPIYEQIADQIVFAVATADLQPGDPVPSVRDLSVQLTVNPNTVVRAYQELERMGVIEPVRGRGMFITSDAAKTCRDRRKELIRDTVKATVREAVSAGLTADDLHALIDAEWPHPIRNGSHKSK